jgi:hypothetical protein
MARATLEEVTEMADQLSPEEKRSLIEYLARQVQTGDQASPVTADLPLEKPPKSLRGIWAGRVPDDFDIDAVLHEIRHEWEKELPELLDPQGTSRACPPANHGN